MQEEFEILVSTKVQKLNGYNPDLAADWYRRWCPKVGAFRPTYSAQFTLLEGGSKHLSVIRDDMQNSDQVKVYCRKGILSDHEKGEGISKRQTKSSQQIQS
jgi:hypothetical protein